MYSLRLAGFHGSVCFSGAMAILPAPDLFLEAPMMRLVLALFAILEIVAVVILVYTV